MTAFERRTLAVLLAVALALGGFFAGKASEEPTTDTVASPHVLTAPSDATAVVEAQKDVCPEPTPAVEPDSAPEPPALPDCIATLSPGQLRGAILPPPSIVSSAPGDPPNGQYTDAALSPATGCANQLANEAAAAWNHVAVVIHDHIGYWLQSNGSASCYRTYPQQVDLRNYWCGQGACQNAAVPGTSNHGWGLAIDAPPQTVSYIHQYAGALFGQGFGSCSDAPWESWHIKYCGGYSGPDPGAYGQAAKPRPPPALHRGVKGKRVLALTRKLTVLHHHVKGHGVPYLARRHWKFDGAVDAAVRDFQRIHHLTADGVVGPHTASALRAAVHHARKG